MVEIKKPTSETTITPSSNIAETVKDVKENVLNVTIDNKAVDQTIEGLKSISKGEIPSNEQLLSGVEQVKDIVDKSSQYVTSSQNIQERAIHLLDIVKQLIEEKNKDQVLQQFIYNTNMFIEKYSDKIVHVVKDTTNDINEQLNQESKSFYESVQNLYNFVFELFRSNSFRLLMIDTLNYLRVVSNKSLTNIHVQANEGLKGAIQRLVKNLDEGELKEKVKDEMDISTETETAPKSTNEWENPFLKSSKNVESSAKKQKTKVVASSVEPSKSDVKSAEVKQDQLEDQIYNRFSELIKEFSSNRSYRKAILGFFNLFDQLKYVFNDNQSDVNDLIKEMQKDEYFIKMKENGEKLLVQWVGNEKVIKDMELSLNDIYKAFSNDKELSKMLSQIEKDTRRYLKDPSLLEKEMDHVKSLLNNIRLKVVEKKEIKAFDRFSGQLNKAIQIMKRDEIINNLNQESKKLIKDLFFDKKGSFQIKSETLNELKVMMISMIKETVSSLTELDIHYVDEDVEYELKGLKLNAADLLPSHVKMSGHSVTDIDYTEENLAESLQGTQSTLVLHLSGMVFHFKDVQFWFKRFSFPQMSDEGLLNIDTGDDGIMIHLKIEIDTSTSEVGDSEWFKYNSITVDIDELKLKFTHCEQHEILLRVLSGYIQNNTRRRFKDQLQEMLQTYFIDGLQRLNHLLEQSSENINRLGDKWMETSGIRELVTGGEGITDTVSRVVSNQLSGYEEL